MNIRHELRGINRFVLIGSMSFAVAVMADDVTDTQSVAEAGQPAATAVGNGAGNGSDDLSGRNITNAAVNIFKSHSWFKPPPPPPPRARSIAQRERAPQAPPLPFTYLGRYAVEGSEVVYIVSKDDRVYDVHLGDVIENVYSVDEVASGRLMFTYLPLKQRQALQLGEF